MYLNHICIASAAPELLAEFYTSILGMKVSEPMPGYWMCAATGRTVLIAPGSSPLKFGAYACQKNELDNLKSRVERAGIRIEPNVSPLFDDERSFAISDPDGNTMVFGDADQPDRSVFATPLAGRLQHLVVASKNIDRLMKFYRDVIGFRLSDLVADENGRSTACFLRGDEEHHCFAIFGADENRLDHHCYEAQSWNDIRDWADHLSKNEVEIMWGPGRHGAGNNLFLFFRDPDGNWLEISAELETVAADKEPGLWPHSERTLNLWGKGLLRT